MAFLRTIAVAILMLLAGNSFAQLSGPAKDTIQLMNGEIMITNVIDTSFYGVKILQEKKNKKKAVIIEGERIFSVKFANGHEKFIYYQDTAIGNEFTVNEARYFLYGERDADKGYRPKWWPAGNFVLGAASAFTLNSFVSFVPPVLYPIVPARDWFRITIPHNTVSNVNYLKQDTYILGYERIARKKNAMRSFVSGVIGLGIGFAARSVYDNNFK